MITLPSDCHPTGLTEDIVDAYLLSHPECQAHLNFTVTMWH
jgi:hypothetical protein